MTGLEDLKPNATIRGLLPDGNATVITAKWFGSEALELTYKDHAGRVANVLLSRHDEPPLQLVENGRPSNLDGARTGSRLAETPRAYNRTKNPPLLAGSPP